MSDFGLIPFGLRLSDEQLVDVSEVDRGKKCGCICPSCRTPLLAKKGEIKEWHFAHAHKGVYKATEKGCEYSFWVSVVLMAKQVIAEAKKMSLPSLVMYSDDGAEVCVAEQTAVPIDEVKVEPSGQNGFFDAQLIVNEYVIAVVFTRPDKGVRLMPVLQTDELNIGILEISLVKAGEWFFEQDAKGEYSKIISSHVVDDVSNKRWLYHPRARVLEGRYGYQLRTMGPTMNKGLGIRARWLQGRWFTCRMCDSKWCGSHVCQSCQTHLYSSLLK